MTSIIGKSRRSRAAVPSAELSTMSMCRSAIPCWASRERIQRSIKWSGLNEATTIAQDKPGSAVCGPRSLDQERSEVGGRELAWMGLLLSANEVLSVDVHFGRQTSRFYGLEADGLNSTSLEPGSAFPTGFLTPWQALQ